MNNNYKELPAFEKNEFKAGDVVSIYGYSCNELYYDDGQEESHRKGLIRGTVERDPDDCYILIKSDGKIWQYHFKQCRKLEKIKPREFWLRKTPRVCPTTKEPFLEYMSAENHYYNIKDFPEEFIKVREVLDE